MPAAFCGSSTALGRPQSTYYVLVPTTRPSDIVSRHRHGHLAPEVHTALKLFTGFITGFRLFMSSFKRSYCRNMTEEE